MNEMDRLLKSCDALVAKHTWKHWLRNTRGSMALYTVAFILAFLHLANLTPLFLPKGKHNSPNLFVVDIPHPIWTHTSTCGGRNKLKVKCNKPCSAMQMKAGFVWTVNSTNYVSDLDLGS